MGAVTERTRLLVICNPNDPTGAYLTAEQIASIASQLPERVHVLVDEALVHFQDAEPVDAVLRLTDALPRLAVIRTFSKVYGLSGVRAGYAVASNASTKLLDAMSPVLGVNALTQSAVAQALKIGGPEVESRRASVIRERAHLMEVLAELPLDVTPSAGQLRLDGGRRHVGLRAGQRAEEGERAGGARRPARRGRPRASNDP